MLRLFDRESGESGIDRVVWGIEGVEAFAQAFDVLESFNEDDVSDRAASAIESALNDAVNLRLTTAYLTGLAVGRRIASVPLTGGAQ